MQEHHNSKTLVHGQYENSLKREGKNNNEGQSQIFSSKTRSLAGINGQSTGIILVEGAYLRPAISAVAMCVWAISGVVSVGIEFHEIEATSGNKTHSSLTKDIRPCRKTHSTSAKVSMRKVRFALEMSTTGNGK
jgi:hypothetical protein